MWTGKPFFVVVVALLGCRGELAGDDEGRSFGFGLGTPGLEAEAKALVQLTGCEDKAQCAAAPVGVRPCGGPRYYLPYCPLSTDTVALKAKLQQIADADRAYNKKHNIVGTCEYRMPPELMIEEGACTAQPRSFVMLVAEMN